MRHLYIFILLISFNSYSQHKSKISLGVGSNLKGVDFDINYQKLLSCNTFLVIGFDYISSEYEYINNDFIPYDIYMFNIGFNKALIISRSHKYKLFGGFSTFIAKEILNNNNNVLPSNAILNNKENIAYGLKGIINYDVYLFNNFLISPKITYQYNINSLIRKHDLFFSLGFQYKL